MKFADEAIDAKQPFFLYIAQCAPHFPLMAPQKIDRQVSRQVQGGVGQAARGAARAAD